MNKMNINIGDTLYRVAAPALLVYKVIGIRLYETGDMYELECQSCTHGFKCKVLAAFDDYKYLKPVHMLNDDEDEPQRHWHSCDSGGSFFLDKNDALRERYALCIRDAKEDLQRFEDLVKDKRKNLERLECGMAALDNQPKEEQK